MKMEDKNSISDHQCLVREVQGLTSSYSWIRGLSKPSKEDSSRSPLSLKVEKDFTEMKN